MLKSDTNLKFVSALRGDITLESHTLAGFLFRCDKGSDVVFSLTGDYLREILNVVNFHTSKIHQPKDLAAVGTRQTAFLKARDLLPPPNEMDFGDNTLIEKAHLETADGCMIINYKTVGGLSGKIILDYVATQAFAADIEECLKVLPFIGRPQRIN